MVLKESRKRILNFKEEDPKMKDRETLSEKNYKSRREVLLKKVKALENIADDFPMFIRRQDLVRYLSRYELFKLILNVKGSIVEGGVHKGASLMLYAQLSSIYEPYAFNREIIGFDTFEGIVQIDDKKDKDNPCIGDFSDSDIDLLKKCVTLYDLNRPLSHISKIRLIKGNATEAIPEFFKKNTHVVVALAYLDFDLYAPTKTALDIIVPRMPKGAVLAFDELNARQWPGETMALLESFGVNKLKIRKFPADPYVSYTILD